MCWPQTSCIVSDDFGVSEVWFVDSMKLVRKRQLVHDAHEHDAMGVRLWRTIVSDEVVRRGNVLSSCFEQLHRCRSGSDVQLVIEELLRHERCNLGSTQ